MSEQIYTNKVSIVHFHIFMSFYSIYDILSRIRFCHDLCFFVKIFRAQNYGPVILKYCIWSVLRRSGHLDRDGSIKQFLERASAHSGAVWNQTKPIALNLDFFQTWVTGCGYGGRSEQRGHWQGALKAEGEAGNENL